MDDKLFLLMIFYTSLLMVLSWYSKRRLIQIPYLRPFSFDWFGGLLSQRAVFRIMCPWYDWLSTHVEAIISFGNSLCTVKTVSNLDEMKCGNVTIRCVLLAKSNVYSVFHNLKNSHQEYRVRCFTSLLDFIHLLRGLWTFICSFMDMICLLKFLWYINGSNIYAFLCIDFLN